MGLQCLRSCVNSCSVCDGHVSPCTHLVLAVDSLMMLRAQDLPGVPGASPPGTCGKGCCGKCCSCSLVNTPVEQKQ